jgi:hypothetical protein
MSRMSLSRLQIEQFDFRRQRILLAIMNWACFGISVVICVWDVSVLIARVMEYGEQLLVGG